MKAQLAPVFFGEQRDRDFDKQLARLEELLTGEADLLEPAPLGTPIGDADAALFPQMLGEAYRRADAIGAISVPRLIITSEFGTMAMWDWEIAGYLRGLGIDTITPYTLAQAKTVCRALAARRQLRQSCFLVFQDNPGEGFQADIFKRFYWWEDECTQRMLEGFGIQIVRRSFKELGAMAQGLSDGEADAYLERWSVPSAGLSSRSLRSAAKLYAAVKRHMAELGNVAGVGINCLNESHFSDTTPCLAWNRLYDEDGLIWGCEADTVSMLTKFIVDKALAAPFMMTNLYPFLMGQAALKHERIAGFPQVTGDPANYVLIAHCGYLGVLPQSFAAQWTLRPKVLAIVDENASAIDARLPEGELTLVKLEADLHTMVVTEGWLEGYAQFPGSDCLNGGVIRVPDGKRLMSDLPSHHCVLVAGHWRTELEMIGHVFGLELKII